MSTKTILAVSAAVAAAVARPEVPADAKAVPAIVEAVTPLVENATNNEPWYQSRVTIGAIVSIAIPAAWRARCICRRARRRPADGDPDGGWRAGRRRTHPLWLLEGQTADRPVITPRKPLIRRTHQCRHKTKSWPPSPPPSTNTQRLRPGWRQSSCRSQSQRIDRRLPHARHRQTGRIPAHPQHARGSARKVSDAVEKVIAAHENAPPLPSAKAATWFCLASSRLTRRDAYERRRSIRAVMNEFQIALLIALLSR